MTDTSAESAGSYSGGCSCSSCDYRSLYEGTIASLSEMASNQRASVSRLGSLRSAIASALEQHFPKQIREAESRSGRRVSDLSDAEVVALMSRMLGERTGPLRRELTAKIAEELSGGEFELPLNSLSEWRLILAGDRSAPAAAPEAQGQLETKSRRTISADLPAPLKSDARPAPIPEPAQQEPSGSVFQGRPLFARAASEGRREFKRPDEKSDTGKKESLGKSVDGSRERGDLEHSKPQEPPHGDATAPSPEDPKNGARSPGEELLDPPDAGNDTVPSIKPAKAAPAELFQPPLRPGVPESARGASRSRRQRRVDLQDSPEGEPKEVEVTADVRSSLTAASVVPRPVFTSDLIAIAGSPEAVEQWEAECRSEPDSSPVRFIAPKSRHRHRGRLVVPASPSDAKSDWWARCVERYRAGRLYELAVVLRSVSDNITSVDLGDEFATIRVSSPSGPSALVVILTPDLSGAGADLLGSILAPLSAEGLSLIALLTASADRGGREALAAAAKSVISERSLKMDTPVVAATSWEYADDPRSSAVFVGESG